MALNVNEDDCQLLGVNMRLSTKCKIWFTLGLFANYFSLKSRSLSLKSHMNPDCPLSNIIKKKKETKYQLRNKSAHRPEIKTDRFKNVL